MNVNTVCYNYWSSRSCVGGERPETVTQPWTQAVYFMMDWMVSSSMQACLSVFLLFISAGVNSNRATTSRTFQHVLNVFHQSECSFGDHEVTMMSSECCVWTSLRWNALLSFIPVQTWTSIHARRRLSLVPQMENKPQTASEVKSTDINAEAWAHLELRAFGFMSVHYSNIMPLRLPYRYSFWKSTSRHITIT